MPPGIELAVLPERTTPLRDCDCCIILLPVCPPVLPAALLALTETDVVIAGAHGGVIHDGRSSSLQPCVKSKPLDAAIIRADFTNLFFRIALSFYARLTGGGSLI
jgi:hypothetical protein